MYHNPQLVYHNPQLVYHNSQLVYLNFQLGYFWYTLQKIHSKNDILTIQVYVKQKPPEMPLCFDLSHVLTLIM